MTEPENRPYWIIDVLPEQVPADSPGRYFTVEKYFLSHLDGICRKFASVLVRLNCYRDLLVSTDGEAWTDAFSPEDLESLFLESVRSRSPLSVRVSPPGAVFSFSGEDHYMTLYGADEELLGLVSRLCGSEGLFVWFTAILPEM